MKEFVSKVLRKSSSFGLCYPYQDHVFKNLIYIHIPKCGGKSVIDAINADRIHHIHAEYYHYQRSNLRRFEKCHKFTVVRNPVNRLASLFSYMKKGGNGGVHDLEISEDRFTPCADLEDFILNSLTPEWLASWVLLRPQAAYIYDQLDRLMIDTVIHLENLDEEFQAMSQKLELGLKKCAHINRSGGGQSKVMLSPKAAEKVYEYYKRDFDLLYPDFSIEDVVRRSN